MEAFAGVAILVIVAAAVVGMIVAPGTALILLGLLTLGGALVSPFFGLEPPGFFAFAISGVVLIAFGTLVNMTREMLAEMKALRAGLQPSPVQQPSVQPPPPVRQPPRQPVSTPDAMEREIGAAFPKEEAPRSRPCSPQVEGNQR